MIETLYLHGNTAVINYNEGYPTRNVSILNSNSFKKLIDAFLVNGNKFTVRRLHKEFPEGNITQEILDLVRQIHVFELDEVKHPLIKDIKFVQKLIEDVYEYWREYQRCSVIYLGRKSKSELVNFIDKDTEFNRIMLSFYRNLQEKAQGKPNKIYRQLRAGTNAAITLRKKEHKIPKAYDNLDGIMFIDSVLLHSPLLLHPKTNKREGHFEEVFENPLSDFKRDNNNFYCYPAKMGTQLAYVYFHKDFVFSGISLANLFEPATTEDIATREPDILVAFGVKDGKDDMVFYNDKENDVVVAKISYQDKIEYFGYMKKIMLTAYNVSMMAKGNLPIHGAMVNISLTNGKKHGVVFMGDSGAGKSEIIEEISNLGGDTIEDIEVIFDDMGAFRINDEGEVVAQGTEIGAFVRLDDLDRALPYQAMDRSIFMNPESTTNARVIIPITDFETVQSDHKVDYFLYANNYDAEIGVKLFDSVEESKATFVEGKRMAKGTTHEFGLTYSFFANPFGPLQQEEVCLPLIDKYWDAMKKSNVQIGEVYTNLGVENRTEQSLKDSAQSVLDLIEK
ncbi:MAG: hypothetical protein GX038_01650 [Erysipelothrix sp.]|nr:hypothetical protein [Erysipelothrix sp.]